MTNLEKLQERLQYHFRDPALLRQALTHRSAGGPHYERLEFLGDAVLNFVVADLLYARFPNIPEGDLSRMRARLVREETLADLANGLQLGDALILGAGELRSGGARRTSILADALEAVFGAIYLDGTFAAVRDVLARIMGSWITDELVALDLKDPKTRLQEYLQARGQALPVYELVAEKGQAHERRFVTRCRAGQVAATEAEESSRRKAEQKAAALMLEQLMAQEGARRTGYGGH